ncbi:hypothetical protein [Actinoplanes sp. HUAS TT8]|uniref:hypothetical protein n=1 Tax=Actinoplanes sp. HUAS TT8 TaxID=3447453 RepID=UPI003F522340
MTPDDELRPPPSYLAFRGLMLVLLGGLVIAGVVIAVRAELWGTVVPAEVGVWRWLQRHLLPW